MNLKGTDKMKWAKSTAMMVGFLFVSLVSTLSYAITHQYETKHQIQAGLTIIPNQPVPEFPIGLALEILFIPIIIYILWRNKQRKKVLP